MTPVRGWQDKGNEGSVAEKAALRFLAQVPALLLSPYGQEEESKTRFSHLDMEILP